jgi:hypothetical protein
VSNDRYGVRGTRARVLMRLATSLDVLDDRPTEWPKPPPGFTTKRKLMPWYDFSDNRRRRSSGGRDAKRRRSGGRDRRRSRSRGYDDSDDRYDNRYDDDGGDISEDNYEGGEHPMLSEGLRSGR